MKITDLLDPRSISLDAAPTSKSETLDKAVELMAASGKNILRLKDNVEEAVSRIDGCSCLAVT